MNTSTEALRLLGEALAKAQAASAVIDDLIAPHDYQDIAMLVARASALMLQSTMSLMQSDPDGALDALESADDLLDAVYDVIDAETDD
jgi:hypothetical protein